MAHSEAIGSPLTNAFEKLGKVLNERSEGRIDAQHFPASRLGSYSQLIEQSRLGTIEATTAGPNTEEAVAPEIAATGGAPGFIYRDEAHVMRYLKAKLAAKFLLLHGQKPALNLSTMERLASAICFPNVRFITLPISRA